MKSSRFEYRIVTDIGGLYTYEFSHPGRERWTKGCFGFDTIENAIAGAKASIARDDFIPTVVEI